MKHGTEEKMGIARKEKEGCKIWVNWDKEKKSLG